MIRRRTRAAFFDELSKVADGEMEALRQVEYERAKHLSGRLHMAADAVPKVSKGALALGTLEPEIARPIRRTMSLTRESTNRAAATADRLSQQLQQAVSSRDKWS